MGEHSGPGSTPLDAHQLHVLHEQQVAGSNAGTAQPSGVSGSFAAEVLAALGAPATANNLAFMNAWFNKEGTRAAFNPMATTLHLPGSYDLPGNSAHVQQYTSQAQGVQATVQTLKNGAYGDVVSALRAGTANVNTTYQGLYTWSGHGYSSLKGVSTAPRSVSGGGVSAGSPVGGTPDKLDMNTLAEQYGWDAGFLRSIPELSNLFSRALNDPAGQWTTAKFVAQLQQTKWWKANSSSIRSAVLEAHKDPATFNANALAKQADIQAIAGQMGVTLSPVSMANFARRAYTTGMDDNQIKAALAAYINYDKTGNLVGDAGSVADQLNNVAYNNGVKLSSTYLLNSVRSVEAGTATPENAEAYIRSLAAGQFPTFAEQIKAGQNMSDIASPYTNAMASTLEIDPAKVDLFDPTIRKALMGEADPKTGVPTATPLWQFEQTLKQDPRWMSTDNARESLLGAGHSILQDWGVVS